MKKFLIKIYERFALGGLTSNDYAKAHKYFSKIYSLDSRRKGIHYNLGISMMGLKRFDDAVENFKKEIELHGENGACLALLGDAAYTHGNRKEALAYYTKSLKLVSEKEKNLINIRIKNTSTERAYKNSLDAHKLFEKGVESERKRNFSEAKKYYAQAIDKDSNHFIAMNNLGAILLNHEKNLLGSLDYFNRAYEINPMISIRQNLKKAEYLLRRAEQIAAATRK